MREFKHSDRYAGTIALVCAVFVVGAIMLRTMAEAISR